MSLLAIELGWYAAEYGMVLSGFGQGKLRTFVSLLFQIKI
jgi:hypothetical protein